ncbi:MAG: HPP family protein [Desulfomonilaceae bacterium]
MRKDSLMGISQKIADIMIPLDKAAIVTVDTPLKNVIQVLRRLYCEVEEGKCTEAGFRAVLVLDKDRQVVGIVDFQCILEVLVPEITGNFPAKVHALWDALGTVSKSHPLEDPKIALRARIMKNAEKRVGDVMLRIKASITIDADVLEALMVLCENKSSMLPVYDGKQPVGVVRDSDLFLRIAAMVRESKRA